MDNSLHYQNRNCINIFFPVASIGHYKTALFLNEIMKARPEMFKYDNMKIAAVYGSFPGMIWNGGRFFDYNEKWEKEKIQSRIELFNENGIAFRITATNCLLEEEHLDDEYCNMINTIFF